MIHDKEDRSFRLSRGLTSTIEKRDFDDKFSYKRKKYFFQSSSFFFFFIFIKKVVKSIEFVRIRRWTTSNERNWSREHVARMFRGIDIGMKALLTVITA